MAEISSITEEQNASTQEVKNRMTTIHEQAEKVKASSLETGNSIFLLVMRLIN